MKKFSVATFNLLNLNEPGVPMYNDAAGWSQEQYDRKIAWTARQIDQLKADVVGFQELWHADSLSRAFKKSSIAEDYQLLIPADATGKKIICAAAVHKDISVDYVEWIEHFPESLKISSGGSDKQTPAINVDLKGFSRAVLHARLKLPSDNLPVHLYVCHFKSKGVTELYREPWYKKDVHGMHHAALGSAVSTIRRTAEAAALRVILNMVMKNTDEQGEIVNILLKIKNSFLPTKQILIGL